MEQPTLFAMSSRSEVSSGNVFLYLSRSTMSTMLMNSSTVVMLRFRMLMSFSAK